MTYQLKFKISEDQYLLISPDVYKCLISHRQLTAQQKEAGGQLFARITKHSINIEKATEPSKLDKRGRFSFLPSIFQQRKEIKHYYKLGLHYIGDWHTHPEPTPTPSNIDISSMQESFRKSKHDLQWFVMIIIGQSKAKKGLYISIVNDKNCIPIV